MNKIDIYNHVMPLAYLELMKQRYKDAGLAKRMAGVRILWDMDARVDMLRQWPEVQQVLTLANPPPEVLGKPDKSPAFVRLANDGMAAICARYPQQFPAFVAALPMNNVPAALLEMDRAIHELGARGVEIKTNVNGRPLDDAEFFQLGSRTSDEDYSGGLKGLAKAPIEYFKMFYGDTVLGGSASALRCGLDFFGPDHVVFAKDCPFDPEGGPMFIREGIRSVEDLQLSDEARRKIYFDNAQDLLRLNATRVSHHHSE